MERLEAEAEEDREKDFYSLGMPEEEMFTFKASENFIPEKERVLKSAAKQKPSQTTASKPFNRRPKRR